MIQEVIDIVHLQKEFEEKYVLRMRKSMEQMWDKRGGAFYDPKEKQMYEDTRIKTEFLEDMMTAFKSMTNYVAVCTNLMEKLATGADKYRLIKDGEFRTSLLPEQGKFLADIIVQNKKILNSKSEDYKL
jgi:hypothetical protein